jgi:hypothetical protein
VIVIFERFKVIIRFAKRLPLRYGLISGINAVLNIKFGGFFYDERKNQTNRFKGVLELI